MWRPERTWIRERNIFFETHQPLHPYYKTRQIDYEASADALAKAFAEWLRSETTDHDPCYADLIYLYLADKLEEEL